MTARIGVLTSGGDAPGMNAAIRAVVRAGITAGAEVIGIRNGWQGAIDGDLMPLGWDDVSGISATPGTVLGTARCPAFLTLEGRAEAAARLVRAGIDRLIVVGGDGSMRGALALHGEWPDHLASAVADGILSPEDAAAHPRLDVVGIAATIDNDLVGTDMTIGTDSALHRIVEAIDAIASTAAFKDRNFVIEVMGRHCGHLALMSAVAGGADYVIVPEQPLPDDWHRDMAGVLNRARTAGRRTSIVVVAEGATDAAGRPVSAEQVRQAVAQEMAEDARLTVLGHVQRGGRPSAFDRWLAALVGHAAVSQVLGDGDPVIVGVRANRPVAHPLAASVAATTSVADLIAQGHYEEAMELRGHSFVLMHQAFLGLSQPPDPAPGTPRRRVGVLHCGGVAPGMDATAQAFVRLGLDRGYDVAGIRGGFRGLTAGEVRPLGWQDIEGWVQQPGSHLGTRRGGPSMEELPEVADAIRRHRIDALVVIGGLDAYRAVHLISSHRHDDAALGIPLIVVPCAVANDLPGVEMAVGADTALNVAVQAVDRIKRSATIDPRAFVVEVTGRSCGFLALTAGVATGAERVYLPEEGLTVADLAHDVARMTADFADGQDLWLAIRNEEASALYTLDLLTDMFSTEAAGRFDVRGVALGQVQQGAAPTPFDRVAGVRFAWRAMHWLDEHLAFPGDGHVFVTPEGTRPLTDLPEFLDLATWRLHARWWLALRPVLDDLGRRPAAVSPRRPH